MKRLTAIAAASVLAAPVSAGLLGLVKKIDTTWTVQAAEDAGLEREVRVGDVVSLTRVFPERLVVLNQEAITEDGRSVLPKDEQLYSRNLESGFAFCASSGRKLTKTGFGPPNSGATDPCFVDSDSDGFFDSSFRIDTYNATIFGRAIRDNKIVRLRPTKFQEVSPSAWAKETYVGIKYVARPIYSGQPVFNIGVGSKALPFTVRSDFFPVVGATTHNEDGEKVIELFGARYTILSDDGGNLKVRVDRAIPSQPFKFRYNT